MLSILLVGFKSFAYSRLSFLESSIGRLEDERLNIDVFLETDARWQVHMVVVDTSSLACGRLWGGDPWLIKNLKSLDRERFLPIVLTQRTTALVVCRFPHQSYTMGPIKALFLVLFSPTLILGEVTTIHACNLDNCLRQVRSNSLRASPYCSTYIPSSPRPRVYPTTV